MRVDIGLRFCCRIWLIKVKVFFYCEAWLACLPACLSGGVLLFRNSFTKQLSLNLALRLLAASVKTVRRRCLPSRHRLSLHHAGEMWEGRGNPSRETLQSLSQCLWGAGSLARQVRDFPPLGISMCIRNYKQRDLTKLVCHDVADAVSTF